MINIKLPLLALLFLCNFAYASDLYVKLGSTTSKPQVQKIQKMVESKGYSLHTQEDGASYKLYVGAFDSQAQAFQALQKLKRVFPAAVAVKLRPQTLTQTSANAQEKSAALEKPSAQKSPKKETKRRKNEGERPFFVQMALGFHNTASEVSGDIAVEEPNASGMSYGVGFGYELSEKIWASINYDMLGTGDVSLSNIYATLNYNFWQTQDFRLYAGALVGHSSLSWDSAPQAGGETTGPTSFFAGAQVGLAYPLGLDGLSLMGSYSLTSYNLKTVLEDTVKSGAIEQSMTHKLQIGLQYNF